MATERLSEEEKIKRRRESFKRWYYNNRESVLSSRKDEYTPRQKKMKLVDNFSFSVDIYWEGMVTRREVQEDYRNSLKECNHITSEIQKSLRRWWKRQTPKAHIIIVTQNNKIKKEDWYSIEVEITQLDMTPEIVANFKEGAIRIINDFMTEYNKQ